MVKNLEGLKNQLNASELAIFDMDGTILDLERLNFSAYADTVRTYHWLQLSLSQYQQFFSGTKTAHGFISFLNNAGISNFDVDNLIAYFRNIKRTSLQERTDEVVKIFPFVVDFFKVLKDRNMRIALATSTIKEFVDIILGNFDLGQYFDLVLTAEDVHQGKPHPEVYELPLQRLDVKAESATVFEDSINGIRSAKSVFNRGIFCTAVLTEGWNQEFIDEADSIIQSYDQAISILK
jgi:HAD superfamily hydrolase (TIGR01509 family)